MEKEINGLRAYAIDPVGPIWLEPPRFFYVGICVHTHTDTILGVQASMEGGVIDLGLEDPTLLRIN